MECLNTQWEGQAGCLNAVSDTRCIQKHHHSGDPDGVWRIWFCVGGCHVGHEAILYSHVTHVSVTAAATELIRSRYGQNAKIVR